MACVSLRSVGSARNHVPARVAAVAAKPCPPVSAPSGAGAVNSGRSVSCALASADVKPVSAVPLDPPTLTRNRLVIAGIAFAPSYQLARTILPLRVQPQ